MQRRRLKNTHMDRPTNVPKPTIEHCNQRDKKETEKKRPEPAGITNRTKNKKRNRTKKEVKKRNSGKIKKKTKNQGSAAQRG